MIPVSDPTRQNTALLPELSEAVGAVLRHGRFIAGPEVAQFEEVFRTWLGAPHAVGVGNGTDAIRLMLEAAGVGPGDEVLIPDFTMIATAESVAALGAVPVLVEIEAGTYMIDADAAAAAVTPRTRAALVVDLFGAPCPLPELPGGIEVFEDACQAHGATLHGRAVGTLGRAGSFSFFPAKNLGGIGDGGMVTTGDPDLADAVRRLRNHGRVAQYEHDHLGCNSRLDSVQAAALLVKMRYIEQGNARRQAIAAAYDERFAELDLDLPRVADGGRSVYNLYVVASDDRDTLRARLAEREVATLVHYERPMHRQPALAGVAVPPRRPERTEEICSRVMSLPCFPELSDGEVEHVMEAVVAAVTGG